MRIRWERLLGIGLLVTAIYLAVKLRPLIGHLLATVNEDCNYDSPIRAIMLGVLCLAVVGGIKLLITSRQETKHD